MVGHDNISTRNRLVKSTTTSIDEQATLVASPFGSFYSAMLPLRVTRVVLLGDCAGRSSYWRISRALDQKEG
jgi:hypothetical protein